MYSCVTLYFILNINYIWTMCKERNPERNWRVKIIIFTFKRISYFLQSTCLHIHVQCALDKLMSNFSAKKTLRMLPSDSLSSHSWDKNTRSHMLRRFICNFRLTGYLQPQSSCCCKSHSFTRYSNKVMDFTLWNNSFYFVHVYVKSNIWSNPLWHYDFIMILKQFYKTIDITYE